MSPIKCDTLCETGDVECSKHTFVWIIKNFRSLNLASGEYYIQSVPFEITGLNETKTKWAVRFYPIYSTSSKNTVSLVSFSNENVKATYDMSILDSNETRQNMVKRSAIEFKVQSDGCPRVWNNYIDPTKLDENTLPDGNLRIVFDFHEILVQRSVLISRGDSKPFMLNTSVHHKQLIKDLNHVFLDKTNNHDVTLACGDQVFYCHKFMLSSRSPVFKAMFQSNMTENESGAVSIIDIHQDVLLEMLQYVYTGCSLTLEKYAGDLLAAAEKYQLDQLKGSCEEMLISKLDVENCIEMLLLAEMNQATNLKTTAVEFFTKNIRKFDAIDWKFALKNQPTLVMEIMECLLKTKI